MHFSALPILRDFDQFLDLIGQSKSLELTRDRGHLRQADLQKFNESLQFPTRLFGTKSQQPSFAVLNAFYYIARAAQFLSVKKSGTANQLPTLALNKDRVRQYDALTADEKYFFLLESLWCFMDWDEAFDARAFWDQIFYLELAKGSIGEMVSIADRNLKRAGKIQAPSQTAFAEIFQSFGLLDLVWDEKVEKKPTRYQFPYSSAAITEIGKKLLPALFIERNLLEWGEQNPFLSDEILEPEEDDPNPAFADAFLPLFDGLKIEKRLYPIVRPFVAGVYSFRASLGADCFRDIAFSGEAKLEDLHEAIQSVFKFDDDHLYVFYMDGARHTFGGEQYFDPRFEEYDGGIPASIFRLGELGLHIGKEFLYRFDFGAGWEFTILVLDIEPGAAAGKKFKLLKTVGKAPKQYEGW